VQDDERGESNVSCREEAWESTDALAGWVKIMSEIVLKVAPNARQA
jgi:hypothetical protein